MSFSDVCRHSLSLDKTIFCDHLPWVSSLLKFRQQNQPNAYFWVPDPNAYFWDAAFCQCALSNRAKRVQNSRKSMEEQEDSFLCRLTNTPTDNSAKFWTTLDQLDRFITVTANKDWSSPERILEIDSVGNSFWDIYRKILNKIDGSLSEF